MSTLWRRAAWVAPAWCAAALALLFHEPLWHASTVMKHSGVMARVPANVLLISVPTLTALYALTFTGLVTSMWGGGRGLREPTETELGCAVLLLRALLVAVLHGFALWAWRI